MDTPNDGYQLKITLHDSKPPIWRRVIVPCYLTFEDLHYVIQAAMGWGNCHLHAFKIGDTEYSGASPDGFVDSFDEFEDERKYRLDDLLPDEKMTFRYEYDFGDSWVHDIVMEKMVPTTKAGIGVRCIGGKMRCPLDDTGGIWGHYHNLKVLADKKDPEHAALLEWYGGPFDAEAFDLEAVDRDLQQIWPPPGKSSAKKRGRK